MLEEKINYYVKALCVLIFRIRFVFPEAFIIAYASLPKLQTLRFADYSCALLFDNVQFQLFFWEGGGREDLLFFMNGNEQIYDRAEIAKYIPEYLRQLILGQDFNKATE